MIIKFSFSIFEKVKFRSYGAWNHDILLVDLSMKKVHIIVTARDY